MSTASNVVPSLYPGGTEQFRQAIIKLRQKLQTSRLPSKGLSNSNEHIEEISRAIICANSPTFLGFVTGGVTPAAAYADNIVTAIDANVQVHLPEISIATDVEDTALDWLLQLFKLGIETWPHKTFTTGATASNVIGLACGRDYVVKQAAIKKNRNDVNVADMGLHGALKALDIEGIQILTTMAHSSLGKAASIVGLGRDSIVDVTNADSPPHFDVAALTDHLKRPNWLSIVVISCGEVNTGRFATDGNSMWTISQVCKDYEAWLHVDAAFGLMARCLDAKKYSFLINGAENLHRADSIGSDGHKLLNVPYDCGFFFSKHRDIAVSVFQNTGAAYLASSSSEPEMISPLNIGIENSRRFRALPVYASLRAYGAEGYRLMVERMIDTARLVGKWIDESNAFVLLPEKRLDFEFKRWQSKPGSYQDIFMIVLFRAVDQALNDRLVEESTLR